MSTVGEKSRGSRRPSPRVSFALSRAIETLESRRLLSTAVLTYHNDNLSTGLNATETQLTPGNVNVSSFGKRYATTVDGQVYSQPPAGSKNGTGKEVVIQQRICFFFALWLQPKQSKVDQGW